MVLWHVEDQTEKTVRKEKYLAEGAQWLAGWENPPELYVPDDGDVIAL